MTSTVTATPDVGTSPPSSTIHPRPAGGSFVRVVRAEIGRVVRPRPVVGLVLGSLAFAVVAAVSTFTAPTDAATVSRRGGARLADLNGPGGATEAFAIGASFAGFLVFVMFIAAIAGEFSGGTFRALLMRYPRRLRLLLGKLTGLLVVTAAVVAVAELLTMGVSSLVAPSQDIDTSAWFSADGWAAALEHFATAYAGVVGWAIFGATLGVVFRSIPIALGVGFAWAGPFENIVVDSWEGGYRYFPGQVLGSLTRGGTAELGFARAACTAAIYAGIAALVTVILTSRRDDTS